MCQSFAESVLKKKLICAPALAVALHIRVPVCGTAMINPLVSRTPAGMPLMNTEFEEATGPAFVCGIEHQRLPFLSPFSSLAC